MAVSELKGGKKGQQNGRALM